MLLSLPCQGPSGELHGGPQPGDKAGRSLGWEAAALVYKPPDSSLVLSRRIREGWLSPCESKGEAGARSGLLMGLCHCECHCLSQMQIPEEALGVETEEAARCFRVLMGNRSHF